MNPSTHSGLGPKSKVVMAHSPSSQQKISSNPVKAEQSLLFTSVTISSTAVSQSAMKGPTV